jgi:four helix bundle protein
MKEKGSKKFDLLDRLIQYSVRIINVSEQLPNTISGKHIALQILRSGTSVAANYGEAQSAESRADFIHKLKVSLKELRETEVWLRIIEKAELMESTSKLASLLKETNELISILFKSIDTARKNQ